VFCSEISTLNTDVTVSIPSIMNVGESDGVAQVCITLSAMEYIQRSFVVSLATNDGTGIAVYSIVIIIILYICHTAVSTSDYSRISSNETFTPGSMSNATRCVNLMITDDSVLEGDQIFTVMLTTSDPDVVLGPSVTIITIIDNDCTSFHML